MASKKGSAKQIPLLEWLSAAAGLLILALMVGLLAVEAFRSAPGTPPILDVEPVGLVKAGQSYLVEIKVHNRSRKTAAAVHIEGVLKRSGAEVETSSASVDYVPGRSQQQAGLVFTRDPRMHQLETRATGYTQP